MKKQIGIIVKGKVLRLSDPQSFMVCANKNGYEIAFQFDAEWDANAEKTARFIWGGKYTDVKFTGSVCPAPAVYKSYSCEVGLLLADEATTTTVAIPCKPSARCGTNTPHPDYIMPPAELVVQTAETIGELKSDAQINDIRISALERKADGDLVTSVTNNNGNAKYIGVGTDVEAIMGVPFMVHILGSAHKHGEDPNDYDPELDIYGDSPIPCYQQGFKDPVDGTIVSLPPAEEMQEICPFLGYGQHNLSIDKGTSFVSNKLSKYANFIFFEGGKAYYHQGCRYITGLNQFNDLVRDEELNEYTPEGEPVLMSFQDCTGCFTKFIVGLVEPIITDISEHIRYAEGGLNQGKKFDGYYQFSYGMLNPDIVEGGILGIELENTCYTEIVY